MIVTWGNDLYYIKLLNFDWVRCGALKCLHDWKVWAELTPNLPPVRYGYVLIMYVSGLYLGRYLSHIRSVRIRYIDQLIDIEFDF